MTARHRVLRGLLATVAIVLALVAAGCGGDATESNSYVDRVNLAQTQFAASFERLSRELTAASTPARDRKTLKSIGTAVDATVVDLREIKPPDKVKAQHADLVEAIAAYGEAIGAAREDLGGGAAQATRAEARLAADTARTSTRVTTAITAINQRLRE